jgi:hypothetical protein
MHHRQYPLDVFRISSFEIFKIRTLFFRNNVAIRLANYSGCKLQSAYWLGLLEHCVRGVEPHSRHQSGPVASLHYSLLCCLV